MGEYTSDVTLLLYDAKAEIRFFEFDLPRSLSGLLLWKASENFFLTRKSYLGLLAGEVRPSLISNFAAIL